MFVSEMIAPMVPAGFPADTAALEAMIRQLRDHGCSGDGDEERATQIGLLETLKSVASAVQAVLPADLARSREAELARTALIPATDGVAVLAALTKHAATATALGDPRGKGALMADELLTRLLRPAAATANGTSTSTSETVNAAENVESVEYLTEGLPSVPAGVDIEIHLVMTDRTLLDGDTEPAILTGYGPIPAPLARHLTRGASPDTTVWVRRLFTDPHTGTLTRPDPRRRLFTHVDRQFLITRDQVCRTPWYEAPIRHADHTQPHAVGGPTTLTNGAGLCAACNQTKEHPGWSHDTRRDGSIHVTTPTGHRYVSTPPEAPRSAPWEADAA